MPLLLLLLVITSSVTTLLIDVMTDSSRMRQVLDKSSKYTRHQLALSASYRSSTERAWQQTLEFHDRPYTAPAPEPSYRVRIVASAMISALIYCKVTNHEPGNVPDPVSAPVRTPKRYAATPEPWQAVSTQYERTLSRPITPGTVNQATTLDLKLYVSLFPKQGNHVDTCQQAFRGAE